MMQLSGKEGLLHIIGKDIQNIFQNIFKQRLKWRREVNRYVAQYYSPNESHAVNTRKFIVCMIDGKMHHGGLGDRLRGIVSVYSLCKELGVGFRIYFDSPFNLDDFLVPATDELDWRIGKEQLCFNSSDALPLFCGTNGTHVERPFQRLWLMENFKKDVKQIHVYTNAILIDGQRFQSCFYELFKMSPRLEASVSKVKKELGDRYIAVTCRFQQLLGDFKEGNYETLEDSEQEKLMQMCAVEIDKLYNSQHCVLPLLLTSDSIRFLNFMSSRVDYVHVVPGTLVHMDYSDLPDIELHLKSFTDLMALSGAERLYLLKGPKMYNSGFPRVASLIGNKQIGRAHV